MYLLSLTKGGVAFDSRAVQEGQLFFALKGAKVDGHDFLEEARKNGACAAVVERKMLSTIFQIVVKDPLITLQELARERLRQEKVPVIGITGSAGKTTTKEFLAQFLAQKFTVFANPRSYNSQITMAQTILNAPQGLDFLILEMGLQYPGELERLVSIAQPHAAIVTSLGLVHAEHFRNLEEICDNKCAIFRSPKTAFGLLPHDLPLKELALRHGSCRKYTFSAADPRADFFLATSDLPFAEAHTKSCAAAAWGMARLLGVETFDFASLRKPAQRFEISTLAGITVVNDSYNASPLSMRAALTSLPLVSGKKIAVLGWMSELGPHCQSAHEEISALAEQCCDAVHYFGDFWPRPRYSSMQELVDAIDSMNLRPGDLVFVKGSRVAQVDRFVAALHDFYSTRLF